MSHLKVYISGRGEDFSQNGHWAAWLWPLVLISGWTDYQCRKAWQYNDFSYELLEERISEFIYPVIYPPINPSSLSPTYLSIHPPTHLYIYLYTHPPVYHAPTTYPSILSSTHPLIHPSFHPPYTSLSICQSIYLPIHPTTHPSIHSFIHAYIYPSTHHPSIHPSTHPSIYSSIYTYIHLTLFLCMWKIFYFTKNGNYHWWVIKISMCWSVELGPQVLNLGFHTLYSQCLKCICVSLWWSILIVNLTGDPPLNAFVNVLLEILTGGRKTFTECGCHRQVGGVLKWIERGKESQINSTSHPVLLPDCR